MKILMVGPDKSERGGISTVIQNTVSAERNFEVVELPNWKRTNRWVPFFKNMIQIRSIIRKEKIDVVHFHVAQKGSFFRKACLMLVVNRLSKTIFHMHASEFDKFYDNSSKIVRQFISYVLNSVDQVVAVSPEWENYYKQFAPNKTAAVYNAVPVGTPITRKKTKNILTLGKIGKRKGSYDLIEVAKRVEKVDSDITFFICGDGEINKFKEFSKHVGNLHVCEWLNEKQKAEMFENTALHFLPSYKEGLPMAILETMSYGISNLSTNVGGIPSVIQDGKNGFICEPGDIEGMTQKIVNFFSNENHEKLEENVKTTINQNFSMINYIKSWEDIYISIRKKI
ncbi:TPA: glycosyltransferase family 4 protein [Enterococcus faecalis]|nr:glycosyltransferase family 4 protein [Enterococcus faecalis]HBI1551686.1 glycosyltransferase family 4 protein [Enterococcus faecalis]HBI1773127.1 glycosyltransferase family 4 protein [Enterococcus faecalis]HBI1794812.1 glycosyltransferase family 4 protein [Enterococcus faecalis]HBI1800665.1 glycosyltransferase family 4 protein [Enterococcus faecalis]